MWLGRAGEINTLQGNLNWVASRQGELQHPVWEGRDSALLPLCNPAESDSANLDHLAELLVRSDSPTHSCIANTTQACITQAVDLACGVSYQHACCV